MFARPDSLTSLLKFVNYEVIKASVVSRSKSLIMWYMNYLYQ
jgi:hypothetical protein